MNPWQGRFAGLAARGSSFSPWRPRSFIWWVRKTPLHRCPGWPRQKGTIYHFFLAYAPPLGYNSRMKIKFLNGTSKEYADLRGVDLRGVDLHEADLREVDLRGVDLREVDLRGADLREVDLRGADLREVDLHEVDLHGANLWRADLRGANLWRADLRGADLRGANFPSPQIVLLARWGEVSDSLTADLMEYDAASHPDRTAFDRWAAGGPCPYNGVEVQRATNFQQKKELWGTGKLDTPYNLMVRVLREKTKFD